MRTGIHCLTQHVFSSLLNCCISPSLLFLSLSFFLFFDFLFLLFKRFLWYSFSKKVFALRLLTTLLFLYFLSHDWGFSLFAVPFSFILSLSFFLAFFLMLAFLFPPFSLSLSLSLSLSFFFYSRLFANFFFSYSLFLIQFFVSYRFSYSGILMFLWLLLYCILSVFSSHIRVFLLFSLTPPFFRSRGLSPRLVFSVFFLCFQPPFVWLLCFFVCLNLFPLRLIIYFCCYRSLSLPLYTSSYLFWFFNALWERLLLLTRIKRFFDIFGSSFFWCAQSSLHKNHRNYRMYIGFQWDYQLLKFQDRMPSDSLYGPASLSVIDGVVYIWQKLDSHQKRWLVICIKCRL